MQTFSAWLLFLTIAGIFLWGVWTLFKGAFKLVGFLTRRRDPQFPAMGSPPAGQDGFQIPPWVECDGRRCPNCSYQTIVVKHEPKREAMACIVCGAYGIVYSNMIEWEIPNEGLLIETLDPSSS